MGENLRTGEVPGDSYILFESAAVTEAFGVWDSARFFINNLRTEWKVDGLIEDIGRALEDDPQLLDQVHRLDDREQQSLFLRLLANIKHDPDGVYDMREALNPAQRIDLSMRLAEYLLSGVEKGED